MWVLLERHVHDDVQSRGYQFGAYLLDLLGSILNNSSCLELGTDGYHLVVIEVGEDVCFAMA